ncbi:MULTISPECIES: WxL domain-containing protein [Weissella]|uniref:WxL domain-containing protein n=1 Tax=Weissella TaxID=46255 RepID=UPI0002193BE2|nr:MULTISPECIES: WxL domain-containing protein [Weissella]APS27065.1 hypothetical protein AUC63_01025 [Weissella cibaria]APU62462.1 hypothetical protein AUC65_00630 [Weissella cibaria]APU64614.1 hypothetical protein AUC62_00624 [Weissella cibaria]ASS52007.1 hypothetical protein CHR48_01063 [Weissella cibaria]KXU09137.1 hypothetical protein WEIDD23_00737 [Weissella sp. DD23]
MIKQLMLGAAVLAGVVGVSGVASAADTIVGTSSDVATNQGKTKIQFSGDYTNESGYENPNADGSKTTAAAGNQAFGLTLLNVPSFDFGSKELSQAAAGMEKGFTQNGVYDSTVGKSNLINAANATADVYKGLGAIVVRDLRGGNTGYQVYATSSSLYNAAGNQLPVSSLALTVAGMPKKAPNNALLVGKENADTYHATTSTVAKVADQKATDQLTDATITADKDDYGKQAAFGNLVLSGNKDTNGTFASGQTSATLKLSSDQVKSGTYTGVITYTLQDTNLITEGGQKADDSANAAAIDDPA